MTDREEGAPEAEAEAADADDENEEFQSEYASAAELQLNQDQQRVVERIRSVMEATDENGQLVYTQTELRDFMVACIFDLGIPMSRELDAVMEDFLDDVDLEGEATKEAVQQAVKVYFEQHPLNPKLVAAMGSLGREEIVSQDEGFKTDGAKVTAAKASVGKDEQLRAPLADTMPKGPAPKVKKGL